MLYIHSNKYINMICIDIKKILNNDIEFQEDLKFIDRKRKAYSSLWLAVVILLASSTIILFITYNLTQFTNTLIFKLVFGKTCNCE